DTGIIGTVSSANSLIGTSANDSVGAVTSLGSYYAVKSAFWDNGATVDGGAVSLGFLGSRLTGAVRASNSVLGTAAMDGIHMSVDVDPARDRLVVGRPASNIVS